LITETEAAPINRSELTKAIEEVCRIMKIHGGAIRLSDVTNDGAVEVQFEGLCSGCAIRPLTLYATIIPTLERVEGVTSVRARGVRLSEESARSLMEMHQTN
jgi:Fe-S cluster biogenesis protein NfuA